MTRSIILLFFLCSKYSFAFFDMNDNMQNAYSHIVSLEFEAAKKDILIETLSNPDNGFIHLYENYIDFLTIIIGEDISLFKDLEKNKDQRILLLKENDKDSPYYLYSQAEVHLQWAFASLKFEKYIPATYEFIKAYYLFNKNSRLYPEFTLNKKGLGLLHSLLGAVPDQYHWTLKIAGLEGDIDLGLSELNTVLEDPEFIIYKNEILFLVSFLQINLKNNDNVCEHYLDIIGKAYTTNYLLNFAAARLSHHLGKNDYCLKVLENRPPKTGKHPFYFLDYLQAMSYLYRLDYENAEEYFSYYVNNFKGSNYIKSSYHKLSWIAELQKDFVKRDVYFKQAINEGHTYVDIDKVALKEARKKYISHPSLLKARLCYDGGYYDKAFSELENIESPQLFFNKQNTIEYWYRMGRISQKMRKKELETIVFFKKTITTGITSDMYYAPMAALQIAIEYERIDENQKAKSYYNRCLGMKGFDYQRGIHQKAKAGLERIKD